MPYSNLRSYQATIDAATLPSQTETALGTLPGVATVNGGQRVTGNAWVPIDGLAGDVEGIIFKVRRGSLTGDAVQDVAVGVDTPSGAATIAVYVIAWTDDPGEVAGLSYVLTAETTSGVDTPAVSAGTMSALVQ